MTLDQKINIKGELARFNIEGFHLIDLDRKKAVYYWNLCHNTSVAKFIGV